MFHPMKKSIIPSAWLLLACLALNSCNRSRTYYISPDGDDTRTGLSEDRAWQTIQRINEKEFGPGDRILFRGGEAFTGTIILTGEDAGIGSSRLTLSSFGEGRAVILGLEAEGLTADSCSFLSIGKLVFRGSGRKSGNTTDGLLLRQCDDIELEDLDVHGFQHSGVHLHQCDDAAIRNVHAHENGFAGIHVTGNTAWDTVNYDNHNLYIGYCVAENNPGDPTELSNHSGNGILASSVKGGTIEYCEAFNNGWDMPWTGNGPVGIWVWDCTDFTIQRCVSHHNRTNPVAADGGGFDLDGGVSHSVIQYCISHHNEGAGFGLYEFGAAKPWENNTIRYNISQDDGSINGGSIGIWKSDNQGVMRNCTIYNNTLCNSLEDGSNIWLYDHYTGFGFYNNVFVYNGYLISEGKPIRDELFLGNLYWNLAGETPFPGYASLEEWALATGREMLSDQFVGRYQDPLLNTAAFFGVTDPSAIDRESVDGFVPPPGSPLVDGGLDLKAIFQMDPGEHDFLGTSIPKGNNYDIGAIELDH
jgi:hypothetical protein